MKRVAKKLESDLLTKLITFPGYAGIILSWLGLAVWFAYYASVALVPDAAIISDTPLPGTHSSEATSSVIGGGAILGALLLGALALLAIWFYVSDWTKKVVDRLARTLHIADKQYWAYCTMLLASGWVLNVAIVLLLSDGLLSAAVSFTAAILIACGAVSFGLAALREKKLSPKPSDVKAAKKQPKTKNPTAETTD